MMGDFACSLELELEMVNPQTQPAHVQVAAVRSSRLAAPIVFEHLLGKNSKKVH